MKTQDRASSAANKPVAGPALGDRLPTPPRERKPALAALAVLLILAGALGATTLVLQAGDRVEAVMLTERVPAGQQIPESAITSVLVAKDSDVNYFTWASRNGLAEDVRPSVDLVPGTVLVLEMLTREDALEDGQVFVGVQLSAGQYPPALQSGDTVAAYRVGRGGGDEAADGGTAPSPIIVKKARVHEAHTGDGGPGGGGALPVTLVVSAEEAGPLAQAASDGEVSLVIVPGNAD